MPKILTLGLVLLLSAMWLQAQENGSSKSDSSGQTSVKGCLQESNGNYTVTSDSGTTYQLQGDTAKLSKHVGHEVEVMGSMSAAGSSSSAMSPNADKGSDASHETIMVDNLKHISKTCKNAMSK